MPSDPTRDEAFPRLVEQWRGDHLGPDKDEGVGLLWKEGGIVELWAALYEAAPATMVALAERSIVLDAGDTTMRAFIHAWTRPAAREREDALNALDLHLPRGTFTEALAALEPPMPRRFRERIEAWLDLARGIEARAHGAVAPPRRPVDVSHPKLGRGRVLEDLGDRARVAFADGTERTVLWRFLAGP